jgi:hypothetical protein
MHARRKLLFATAAGAAALSLAVPVTAALASSRQLAATSPNLLKNPGAELGPGTKSDSAIDFPPDWTADPAHCANGGPKGSCGFTAASYAWNYDLSDSSPGPPLGNGPNDRGKNYFYGGGADQMISGASQVVSLAKYRPSIAAGTAIVTLSGWLGGYGGQRDHATVSVQFKGSTGQPVGTPFHIGGVNYAMGVSGLYLKRATSAIPKTATSALVIITMTRLDGSDNDGLADNLSFTVTYHT